MIKYLGSKRRLVDRIVRAIQAVPTTQSVLDLFSGTSRVGHALKKAGYRVISNDHNAYAHTLATCYVAADCEDVSDPLKALLTDLESLPPVRGYFTRTFSESARYVQPHNAMRIDAMREFLEQRALSEELRAVALVALMEAADRVDSTTGVQMAFLKEWSARSYKPLALRVPDVLPRAPFGKGEAHRLDAIEAASVLAADVAYIDPPYNQHSYLGNYHVWETLVRWDAPEVYGVAKKRADVRERRSVFNSRRSFSEAFRTLIAHVQAPTLIVSFSDEGFVNRDEMITILQARGDVGVIEIDNFPRYVGAQIGVHDPQGRKVGTPSHRTNREFLFIVGEREIVREVVGREEAALREVADSAPLSV